MGGNKRREPPDIRDAIITRLRAENEQLKDDNAGLQQDLQDMAQQMNDLQGQLNAALAAAQATNVSSNPV